MKCDSARMPCWWSLPVAVLLLLARVCVAQGIDSGPARISLARYNASEPKSQVVTATAVLPDQSDLIVQVTDVPVSEIDFFVIQVHSFGTNVLITDNINYVPNSYVNGTNLGLVQVLTGGDTYQFFVKNDLPRTNNTVLLAVVAYSGAPIPGGCNMEFETELAPYQKLSYSDAIVTVDAESASVSGHSCEQQVVKHEMYHMYLTAPDYTAETYFAGIEQLLTVPGIMKHASLASTSTGGYLRRLYSAYRGTGTVYVTVADFNGRKSAYVPIVTYACDPLNAAISCEVPTTVVSRLLYGSIVFLGVFMCFCGHNFFKSEMALVGALFGGYVAYVVFSVAGGLNESDTILVSLLLGCVVGVIWLAIWWYCGIPVLSTLLPLIMLGYLFASIVFYAGLADVTIVHSNITFWGFLTAIVLLTVTVLTGFMHNANILACAIVGSYAIIISSSFYTGSHLMYIFINSIRRATVRDFNTAIVHPPYQYSDLLLTLLWILMALLGAGRQNLQQKGRPPFPPARTRSHPAPDERTPLLVPTSSQEPADRIILIHSVPYDG